LGKKGVSPDGPVHPALASLASAEQPAELKGEDAELKSFGGDLRIGYRWVSFDGNPRAGEYEYLHSSDALFLDMEWDRLPHRFLLEYYALNEKDFFKSLDYAFRDTVMFNITSRGCSTTWTITPSGLMSLRLRHRASRMKTRPRSTAPRT